MKVPDLLLLAAMGIAVVAAAVTIALAWEVPDANAQEVGPPVPGQASLTLNKKTASVRTGERQNWKVSPGLLHKTATR